jgi:hypothetical protein
MSQWARPRYAPADTQTAPMIALLPALAIKLGMVGNDGGESGVKKAQGDAREAALKILATNPKWRLVPSEEIVAIIGARPASGKSDKST